MEILTNSWSPWFLLYCLIGDLIFSNISLMPNNISKMFVLEFHYFHSLVLLFHSVSFLQTLIILTWYTWGHRSRSTGNLDKLPQHVKFTVLEALNADADSKDLACCKPQLDVLAKSLLFQRAFHRQFRTILKDRTHIEITHFSL